MSRYDAERMDYKPHWWFKYRTEVFYGVHTIIVTFRHRSAVWGYLRTAWEIKRHKRTTKGE